MRHAFVIVLLVGCTKEQPAPTQAMNPLLEACPGPVAPRKEGPCTKKGCENGLAVVFQPKAPWPEGDYRFQFELDGRTTVCTGRIPFRGCAHRNAMCDSPDVVLAESGCDLPAPSHTFWSATFATLPREVKASAFVNGKQVGNATLKPKYERSEPNGPGCDPICCSGTDELQLTF